MESGYTQGFLVGVSLPPPQCHTNNHPIKEREKIGEGEVYPWWRGYPLSNLIPTSISYHSFGKEKRWGYLWCNEEPTSPPHFKAIPSSPGVTTSQPHPKYQNNSINKIQIKKFESLISNFDWIWTNKQTNLEEKSYHYNIILSLTIKS